MPQQHVLGGGGESVVDGRVSQVVSEVLERSLSGHNGLDEESEHGEHGETSVLDLLDLELGESIRVVGESQRVERTSRVEAVKTIGPVSLNSTVPVSLDGTHEDNLDNQGRNDGVGVDQTIESEVLDTLIGEDLLSGLEPGHVAGVGAPLRHQASDGAKHGPTGVDELELTVLGKRLRVGRESSGIPAVVSRELTGQVGDLRGERSQVLGAVGSVPLDLRGPLGLRRLGGGSGNAGLHVNVRTHDGEGERTGFGRERISHYPPENRVASVSQNLATKRPTPSISVFNYRYPYKNDGTATEDDGEQGRTAHRADRARFWTHVSRLGANARKRIEIMARTRRTESLVANILTIFIR